MKNDFPLRVSKNELDKKVLDIEFLLISVVQGVALAALAANASELISKMQIEYFLYVISGFLLILTFWSQAIIHTISFIDWPLDLTHNFFYFLLSFIEVLAFSHMTDPIIWFAFFLVFFIATGILYMADLAIIKRHEKKFSESKEQKKLYEHILKMQLFELRIFLPLGLLYNMGVFITLYFNQQLFIQRHFHVLFSAVQVFFQIIFLIDSIKSFKKRSALLSDCISAS